MGGAGARAGGGAPVLQGRRRHVRLLLAADLHALGPDRSQRPHGHGAAERAADLRGLRRAGARGGGARRRRRRVGAGCRRLGRRRAGRPEGGQQALLLRQRVQRVELADGGARQRHARVAHRGRRSCWCGFN